MTPAKKTRPLRPEEIDLTDAMFSFYAPRDFCLDLWRLSMVCQFRTFKNMLNYGVS